ncbi:MAG: aminoacyl-tRNA hydrolase [Bacteroidales bacterium]|nr:aminoacyl-tRNA hydrolase [Bacteroidales bacterium]
MAEYLIAGLGNIGNEYASTRHNMGFMTLDAWAQASNAVFHTARYGDVAEFSLKGRKVTLLKPSTYMNLSGYAVRYWVNHLEIPLENLLVICDDLNLPFGTIRMRRRGSCGGHNGLASIEDMLESQDYTRIRVGIGNEFSRGGQVDYVLGSLSSEEMDSLPDILERTIAGAKDFVLVGPEKAMNFLKARPKVDNSMLQSELDAKKSE